MRAAELLGSVLAMTGAWLVSGYGPRARWGWGLWLASNACIAVFALLGGFWTMLIAQGYFCVTNLRGLRRQEGGSAPPVQRPRPSSRRREGGRRRRR